MIMPQKLNLYIVNRDRARHSYQRVNRKQETLLLQLTNQNQCYKPNDANPN